MRSIANVSSDFSNVSQNRVSFQEVDENQMKSMKRGQQMGNYQAKEMTPSTNITRARSSQ